MIRYRRELFKGAAANTLLNGIVSYWNFNEIAGNLLDQVASNDGTLGGAGTVQGVAGKINTAYSFDGNGYVTIGDILSGPTAFSISIWIKKDANGNTEFIINKGIGGGVQREYDLLIDGANDKLNVLLFDEDINVGIATASNTALTNLGVWYNSVTTWDGTNIIFYLNGFPDGGGVNATIIRDTSSDFTICHDLNFAKRYFTGDVDEVGIWSRALTSAEVTTLYNGGNGLTYPF